MKVYQFLHNDFVWESAAHTVSIHRTIAGAYKAMRTHRLAEYEKWRGQQTPRRYRSIGEKEGWAKWWGIVPIEIIE